MNALGYHIYAGGFTVGVSKHFKVLGHLEHGTYGVKTCQANFPKLDIRVGKENWNIDDYLYTFNEYKDTSKVDFLYGNPPCAAFSVIGKHKGSEDPRLEYHRDFQKLVKQLRPTVAALESVQGLLTKGSELVEEFQEMCEKNDYAMYIVKHDAQYLGVPQARRRVFLVASKVALDFFKFPLTDPIPCGKAIKGVKNKDKHIKQPATSHKHNYLLKHIKPGESMDKVFDRVTKKKKRGNHHSGGVSGRPSFCIIRPKPDKVSNAVIGYVRVHPTEDRWMNINEYKALCSYPQDYKLLEGKNIESAAKLLTRAVMPGVGEWLAKVVKAGIKAYKLPGKIRETINVKPYND